MAITYLEVEQVAEDLVQEGHTPTIDKVRAKLGTGSNSTIAKYLGEWKQTRLSPNIQLNKFPPDPVNQAVAKVWQQLQTENQSKLEVMEAESVQKIQLVQEEKKHALNELHRIMQDNQDLRALLKENRDRNEILEKEQIQLSQTVAVLEAKYKMVEESKEDFQGYANQTLVSLEEKYQQVLLRHETQLMETRKSYSDDLSQIKEKSESRRHQYIVEIDHLKTDNKKLQMQLAEKDKMLMEINSRVGRLSAQTQNQQENIMDLLSKFQKNEQSTESFQIELKSSIEDVIERNLDSHMKTQFTALQRQVKELQSGKGKIK